MSITTTKSRSGATAWALSLLFLLVFPSLAFASVHATKVAVGPNIDVANLPGTQFETSIAVNPNNPLQLVAGSIEVNPATTDFSTARVRAYFSSDGGATWGNTLIPLLPNARGETAGTQQQHDPSVAWDALGNVYFSYVGFNEVASHVVVVKSSDGGRTWTSTVVDTEPGFEPFLDKALVAVDTNPGSPFFNNVYVAWDTIGRSNQEILLFSRSTDHGVSFSTPFSPAGHPTPASVSLRFEADPFVGPDGTVYLAWEDTVPGHIVISASTDGGLTFGSAVTIGSNINTTPSGPYAAVVIPAVNNTFDGSLVYPACGADSSSGPHRGTLYCSWMDETATSGTDIFVARSTDHGQTWSQRVRVNDDPTGIANDQFGQWLTVDPTNGRVSLSWYDTRNDPAHLSTDVFYASSTDGGMTFSANVQVTTAPTDVQLTIAPCGPYGQDDYQGITAYGGVVHLAWTDARTSIAANCQDVFTATIS